MIVCAVRTYAPHEHGGFEFRSLGDIGANMRLRYAVAGAVEGKDGNRNGKSVCSAIRLERDAGANRPDRETGTARRGLGRRGIVHLLGSRAHQLGRRLGRGECTRVCASTATSATSARAAGLAHVPAKGRRFADKKMRKRKNREHVPIPKERSML
jgi:hypothetical protein